MPERLYPREDNKTVADQRCWVCTPERAPVGALQIESVPVSAVIQNESLPFWIALVLLPFSLQLARNDTQEKRSNFQVRPRGDRKNPLRGVFATHSPVRPNLAAMSQCKIISVKDNVIEIESVDAFPDTPVLDRKN